MKKGAWLVLCWGIALVPPLRGQGIISDAEINTKREEDQHVAVVSSREVIYNPVAHSEAGSATIEPVLDEQTYFEDNIIESGQIAVDRVYDLIPFPSIFPYNVLSPEIGYLRADNKWDVETRASIDWAYNNNVSGSPTHRDASQVVSVGTGVMARIGSARPDLRTGAFSDTFGLRLDYNVVYDRYLDKPDYDALSQRMDITTRLGTGNEIVLTPNFHLGDVTSQPPLDPDRLGLTRMRYLTTGLDVGWKVNDFAYRGSINNSMVNQPDNGLIDYEAFGTYQEIGYSANALSRYFAYGSYNNLLPDRGSFVWQGTAGVGYEWVKNDPVLGQFRWKTRIGWQQITWNNNPFITRNNSGLRGNSELGFYLTPRWEWILHVGRDHQIDTSIADNGYLEDYLGATIYYRPTPMSGIGLLYYAVQDWSDTNNSNPFMQKFSLYANYRLSYHTLVYARFSYSHSTTAETPDPDAVSFVESVGIEFRF